MCTLLPCQLHCKTHPYFFVKYPVLLGTFLLLPVPKVPENIFWVCHCGGKHFALELQTHLPILPVLGDAEYQEKKRQFNVSKKILKSDKEMKRVIKRINLSCQIDCIIVKDVLEREQDNERYKPLKRRLF